MKAHTCFGMAFLCLGGLSMTRPSGGADAELQTPVPMDGRPWTASDSTRVRYFLRDQSDFSWSYIRQSEEIVVSPNGEYFFFVSYYGDLECNCNTYELTIYAASDVIDALEDVGGAASRGPPPPVATVSNKSPTQAIRGASWDHNSSGVIYLGESGTKDKQLYQLYRLDLKSGRTTALTDSPAGTGAFYRQGEGLVFNSRIPREVPPDPDAYPIHPLAKGEIFSKQPYDQPRVGTTLQTFVSYRGRPSWPLRSGLVTSGGPWFARDGRFAVMVRRPPAVSSVWSGYDGTDVASGARQELTSREFPQFMFIDLDREVEEPVFDAPTGEATQMGEAKFWHASQAPLRVPSEAFWSHDGRQVVLVNTALPLSESNSERRRTAYIVSLDVETRQWKILEPLRSASGATVRAVKWMKPGHEFLVQHDLEGKPASGTIYTLRAGGWHARAVSASTQSPNEKAAAPPVLRDGLSVILDESANKPPTVTASKNGRSLTITKPDPALNGIWWAQTLPFEWRDAAGHLHTDGLLLPKQVKVTANSLPLVIQAGYYLPDQFRPDGPFPTGYAAQAMVAKGMAVLNLTTPKEIEGTPQELPTFVQWIESAARALAKQHPIDLNRVGLMGFSHTAFQTYYAITHPNGLRLGAAVIADGVTGSYLLYLDGFARGGFAPAEFERLYGGPFSQAKSKWLEEETTFNVHRVNTPAMFVAAAADMYALETVGAFKANNRPLEYLIMPNAAHQLEHPRQRQASIEATADWMSFWLQQREDDSPDKAAQYRRWRNLREQHDSHQAANQ